MAAGLTDRAWTFDELLELPPAAAIHVENVLKKATCPFEGHHQKTQNSKNSIMNVRFRSLCLICILISVYCSHKEEQEENLLELYFNVADSLLAQRYVDSTLHISFAPPKDWRRVPDSVLNIAQSKIQDVPVMFKSIPRYAFIEDSSRASYFISKIDSLNPSEGKRILEEMKRYFEKKFEGQANIQTAIFLTQPFRVHQLMASTTKVVILKMIFDSKDVPTMFELDYVIPLNVYAGRLRAVESSIGSIKLTH